MKSLIVGFLAACSLALALTGQSQLDTATSRQLADAAIAAGRSYEYVSELTGTFGSRLTGSNAYERSVDWSVAQFRAAGVTSVTTEPFTIAYGWERGAARGRIL
jgi:hypothetical protein